jgi:hypothetical protein
LTINEYERTKEEAEMMGFYSDNIEKKEIKSTIKNK